MADVTRPFGSEAFYRTNLEAVMKENKGLKQRIEQLERENRELKKSVFDLSYKLSVAHREGVAVPVFDIDAAAAAELPAALEDEFRKSADAAGARADEDATGGMFELQRDLTGHTGAVYDCRFSPCGRFLASCSFDATVRLWDVAPRGASPLLWTAAEHQQLVSCVCWSADGARLASGSYDRSVKAWDVGSGAAAAGWVLSGFVMAVQTDIEDPNIAFAGSTDGAVAVLDLRAPSVAATWSNESVVNAIYAPPAPEALMTGDARGMLKYWDRRTGAALPQLGVENDASRACISHIASSPPTLRARGDDGAVVAVNSYDDSVRVYKREPAELEADGAPPAGPALRLLHELRGHRNKSWPIKSAMYRGPEHRLDASRSAGVLNEDAAAEGRGSLAKSLLLATGSADHCVYVFDISGPTGTAAQVQQLLGHTDRVYATAFHPQRPLMASASADFAVKLWMARKRTRRP